jgi:uncharacterized caspase-like protein
MFNEALPQDTVVLFLAGHGVYEGSNYLFLPEDAEKQNGHWLPSSTVNWSTLQSALQSSHGRRIMFVDTCHAGGAYNARLVKDAADADIVVFSATDEVTLAQESEELKHGVFSYALAEGLNGEADIFKNGKISIFALATYVSNEVERITNYNQEPKYNVGGSTNFVLAVH